MEGTPVMQPQEYGIMSECEDWHWWYSGLRQILAVEMRKAGTAGKTLKLLDVGCGTGGQTLFIKKSFPSLEITGIDLRPAVAIAKKRGDACLWIEGFSDRLPAPEETFDLAVCLDVLCGGGVHEEKTLSEVLRVLKPGGTLFINLPAFEFLKGSHDQAVNTARRYSGRQLSGILTAEGFEIVKIRYWNFLMFPLIFAVRMLRRVCGKGDSDLALHPSWTNSILKSVLSFERGLSFFFEFPFGVSLFAVARKPVAFRVLKKTVDIF